MKYKFIVPLLIVCLLLSACGGGSGKQSEVLENDSSRESAKVAAELTAKFPELDHGLEALKILLWGSHGWELYSGGEYIFASFGNHLVRYSIGENKVDSVVEFHMPEYWWRSTSVSADGENVVAKAGNHPEYDVWTNQILIDFQQKTCKTVSDDYKLSERELLPQSLYRVEKEWSVENKMFYKLYNEDDSGKYKEIWAIPQYAVSLSEYVIIDENRIGIIMGTSEESNGYLGYDKFVIIDITQDKIMQECIINEWDGYGREYWNQQ